MEELIGRFQADLGKTSEEIRGLQARARPGWRRLGWLACPGAGGEGEGFGRRLGEGGVRLAAVRRVRGGGAPLGRLPSPLQLV